MKRKFFLTTLLLPLVFSGTTQAEVIYSNLKDISIPYTYDAVYLNILSGIQIQRRLVVRPIDGLPSIGTVNSPRDL